MSKYDLIIIAGAPGAGKSSIADKLNEALGGVYIDFGRLREFHLDRMWKKANKREEQMTFENLVYIIRNYLKEGYKNIIVDDLLFDKVERLEKIFRNKKLIVLVLTVSEKEHRRRIRYPTRDSGFKNLGNARKYAEQWEKSDIPRSVKINVTNYSVEEAAKKILEMIR